MRSIRKIFNKFFLLKIFFAIFLFSKVILANNTNIALNYIYVEPTTGISDEREEINFSLNHTFNDNYSLSYSIKEDLSSSGGMLGQKLALLFDNECFTTEIGLHRSYYLDREIKPNDTFLITFTFKTLGTVSTGRNISN